MSQERPKLLLVGVQIADARVHFRQFISFKQHNDDKSLTLSNFICFDCLVYLEYEFIENMGMSFIVELYLHGFLFFSQELGHYVVQSFLLPYF